jgi:hypothetical protein
MNEYLKIASHPALPDVRDGVKKYIPHTRQKRNAKVAPQLLNKYTNTNKPVLYILKKIRRIVISMHITIEA